MVRPPVSAGGVQDTVAEAFPRMAVTLVGGAGVVAGTTVLVSRTSIGQQVSEHSAQPELTADGKSVVFSSDSLEYVAGDNNQAHDVFLRDLVTGIVTIVSVKN